MIPEETIKNIKDSASAFDIISLFLKTKKKGSDYVASCPFHDEKSPSFTISISKNMFKCFGCGKSGDGITFLMEHEKMNYIAALTWVAEKNNIQINETGNRKKIEKPLPRIDKLKKETVDYFENNRKISYETLIKFGVTEAEEWMPKAKAVIPAICFNYYKDDQLVNIKFRGKGKDFKMVTGAELIFYNLNSIKHEETVYITEGEIDCMSLHEAGVHNTISVPNGASLNGNVKLEYLDNCFHYFLNKKKVVLVVDNDAAGLRLQEELARRIGYEKCYLVKYLDGCKDANDVLIRYGKDALKSVLESSRLYPLVGEVVMDDMYDDIVDFYENGYPLGAESHVSHNFDELLTFTPGQLTIVTGIPGSGKSEFIDFLMVNLSKHHQWNWGVCSFECEPKYHVTKLQEKFTNKSFAFRKDINNRMDKDEFMYSIGMIDKHFHFMNLSLIDITIDGLISKAEEFVVRYGINGFLFDPWNCIEAKGEGTEYVLQCLNKIINFLRKYKVHGFLVAHPTKLQKDKQTGKYEVPTLYNISGSAHFFNRTDNGISVYRDFESGTVDIYVQKVKHYWTGKQGFCSYSFDVETRRYNPL